jgi:hypothetical protein
MCRLSIPEEHRKCLQLLKLKWSEDLTLEVQTSSSPLIYGLASNLADQGIRSARGGQ